jgi:mannose-6-phosphate isomerase-like protein (cupin superfamily)
MHCVGEYPTGDANLNLSQIALLGARYPAVPIGYSTHERPDNYDAVKVAIGIGARIFEKHVGVETDSVKLNGYSANPQQVRRWLEAASTALTMCGAGGERYAVTAAEAATLRDLQRGVFARRELRPGATLRAEDVFFAIPGAEGQVRANDMSKYTSFELTQPLAPNQPVLFSGVNASNTQARLYRIISDVKKLLRRSKVVVPGQLELEISHHYGIDQFEKTGSTIITVVNREYCKRIIVMLAGQRHPEQHHRQKDETYHLLFGEITLTLDDVQRKVRANEVVVIPRGTRHGFFTGTGAVIEEVSSYYTQGDSFYTDPAIEANKNRKTWVTYWMG